MKMSYKCSRGSIEALSSLLPNFTVTSQWFSASDLKSNYTALQTPSFQLSLLSWPRSSVLVCKAAGSIEFFFILSGNWNGENCARRLLWYFYLRNEFSLVLYGWENHSLQKRMAIRYAKYFPGFLSVYFNFGRWVRGSNRCNKAFSKVKFEAIWLRSP